MSMYRFVKDNSTSSSKRLFVQGTTDKSSSLLGPPIVTNLFNPDEVQNLQAIHTQKRLSTEVLGSSIESTKTTRKNEDGSRRITTRIVRKVTTLTRGEENSYPEDLTKRAVTRSIKNRPETAEEIRTVDRKRVKVSYGCKLLNSFLIST